MLGKSPHRAGQLFMTILILSLGLVFSGCLRTSDDTATGGIYDHTIDLAPFDNYTVQIEGVVGEVLEIYWQSSASVQVQLVCHNSTIVPGHPLTEFSLEATGSFVEQIVRNGTYSVIFTNLNTETIHVRYSITIEGT